MDRTDRIKKTPAEDAERTQNDGNVQQDCHASDRQSEQLIENQRDAADSRQRKLCFGRKIVNPGGDQQTAEDI